MIHHKRCECFMIRFVSNNIDPTNSRITPVMSYKKGKPYTLTILGAGTIGQALLSAYLASEKGQAAPSKIIACVRSEESARKLEAQYAGTSSIKFETSFGLESNRKAVIEAAVVVIGTKPYITESALYDVGYGLMGKLLISMVAGWTIEQFRTYSSKVSRVMTNTPAKYQYGTAVISNSPSVSKDERQLILEIVSPIGKVVELPEKNLDAATALVGSGPAFVLGMLEALVESGLSLGIPYKESLECSIKVMEGTAKMVELSGTHPGELKHKVCTPGGTTIAGLVEMESHAVKSGIIKGVQAAAHRASELGKK